jgi:hypothetical protein
MPLPVSEKYRLAALEWVDLDHAARLLEDTKSSVLAQKMAELGDCPVSRAEATVKASADWREFVLSIVNARTEANRKKVEVEFLRMRFSEWQSHEANDRIERKMS